MQRLRARSLCCRSPPVAPCTCRCDTAGWACGQLLRPPRPPIAPIGPLGLTVYQPSAREPPASPTAWLAPCRLRQTPPRPSLPRAMRQLASACRGLSPLPGGLCSARRHNKTNESLVTFCRDGSGLPPPPATSARSRRIFLTLIPRLERCCCRRQDRMPPGPSQSSPRLAKSPCLLRTSASCCSAGCGFRSQSRPAHVLAAATLIRSGTTGLHVPRQGCLHHVRCLSRGLSRACARKPAPGSPAMSVWLT